MNKNVGQDGLLTMTARRNEVHLFRRPVSTSKPVISLKRRYGMESCATMKYRWCYVGVVIVLLAVTSCNRSKNIPGSNGKTVLSQLDRSLYVYSQRGQGQVRDYLLLLRSEDLADHISIASSSKIQQGQYSDSATIGIADELQVEISYDSGEPSIVLINDTSFHLDAGSLFMATGVDGVVTIEQIELQVDGARDVEKEIERLKELSKDLKMFISSELER